METIALYIGYAVLGMIGIALFNVLLFVSWLTVSCCWRMFRAKQTIRFLQKPENQTSYTGVKAALALLRRQGFNESLTLKEIEKSIETARRHEHFPTMEQ